MQKLLARNLLAFVGRPCRSAGILPAYRRASDSAHVQPLHLPALAGILPALRKNNPAQARHPLDNGFSIALPAPRAPCSAAQKRCKI